MERTTFNSEIHYRLGGNLIDVELENKDYDIAFKLAKRTFQQKGSNNLDKNFYMLPIIADQEIYTIDAAIHTIFRVIRPSSTIHVKNPFEVAYIQGLLDPIYSGGGTTALLDFHLTMQTLEDIERFGRYDVDFIYKRSDAQLTFLQQPKVTETWFLEVLSNSTDEEYRDNLWIQNWAYAESKIMLGQAYRKFTSLSSPTGENALAGDQMISEAIEEKRLLIEDIANYIDGEPTGGTILMG